MEIRKKATFLYVINNPIIYKFFKDIVVDMDRAGVVDMANILKWREGRYKGRGERSRNGGRALYPLPTMDAIGRQYREWFIKFVYTNEIQTQIFSKQQRELM